MMIRILLPVALTSLILSPLVSLDPLGNFTFSKCKVQQPLDTFGNVSGIEDCQKRCQSNYRCGFFTLNMAFHVCDLFTGSGDTFTRDCLEVGGPKNIDFTDWMLDSNPCKYFLEGECLFDGNYLEQFADVSSSSKCQKACTPLDQCNHFLSSLDSKICTLHDIVTVTCEKLYGPRNPDFSECLSG